MRELNVRVPSKLCTGLPHDIAIPLIGVCPKELKTGVQTKTCPGMFMADFPYS
jgi:hypothetical protein